MFHFITCFASYTALETNDAAEIAIGYVLRESRGELLARVGLSASLPTVQGSFQGASSSGPRCSRLAGPESDRADDVGKSILRRRDAHGYW